MGRRLGSVLRTAVPEAAVIEHRDTLPRKCDIWGHSDFSGIDPQKLPESETMPVQSGSDAEFGQRVDLPIGSHHREYGWTR
jgi:hypothetical protein